jgi:hypothetical protein
MKKTELIERLKTSASLANTFIPVTEVILLIEQLEDETPAIDEETFDCLVRDIVSDVNNEGVDLIDDYSLEMQHREVILEDVELDRDRIERVVGDVLRLHFGIRNF